MGLGKFFHCKDDSAQRSIEGSCQSCRSPCHDHISFRNFWPPVGEPLIHLAEETSCDLYGGPFPADHPASEYHKEAGQDLDEKNPQAQQFANLANIPWGSQLNGGHDLGNTAALSVGRIPVYQPPGNNKACRCDQEKPAGMTCKDEHRPTLGHQK